MDEVLVKIGGKNTMPEFTENLRAPRVETSGAALMPPIPEDSNDKRLAGRLTTT